MAYNIGYDVVIDEEELEKVNNRIQSNLSFLQERVREYDLIMEHIRNDAVISGTLHDRLEEFIPLIEKLSEEIEELKDSVGGSTSDFISLMDEADENVVL